MKNLYALITSVVLVLFIAGCSIQSQNSPNTKDQKPTITKETKSKKKNVDSPVGFLNYITKPKNDSIWLIVKSNYPEKDSDITGVIHSNGGLITYYDLYNSEKTLRDFDQLNNKEILNYAIEYDKGRVTEFVSNPSEVDEYSPIIEDLSFDEYRNFNNIHDVSAKITTDGSGNNTISEKIPVLFFDYFDGNTEFSFNSIGVTSIYDNSYLTLSGMLSAEAGNTEEASLLNKIDRENPINITFDSSNTKNVTEVEK
ncbi:Uncharacterised protein [Streptococcus uberis]|uniref:hypothetical protein n=1 Tax=Streptococcus uberis TaxID=1349 RepID=UPI000DA28BC5|nr:hypothetical protein [Streptococcus uberis]SQG83889.1 Uncharacterised protein [Streptococcus uberis]